MIEEQKAAKAAGNLGAIEKKGVATGRFAVNPFNGERVPIWVGNYILADYGTGAIMSVPAHDERDFEFAMKYGLEIRRVIAPAVDEGEVALPYTGEEEAVVIDSGRVERGGLSRGTGEDGRGLRKRVGLGRERRPIG